MQLVSDVLVKSSPREPGSGSAAETGGSHQQPSFNAGQLTAAEQPLLALQRLYQQEIELSVQPLRHPRMLQLLLSGAACMGALRRRRQRAQLSCFLPVLLS